MLGGDGDRAAVRPKVDPDPDDRPARSDLEGAPAGGADTKVPRAVVGDGIGHEPQLEGDRVVTLRQREWEAWPPDEVRAFGRLLEVVLGLPTRAV